MTVDHALHHHTSTAFLDAARAVVTSRVEEVAAVLADVGGDPTSFGGHGLDLAQQLRQWTAVPGKQVRPRIAHAGYVVAGGDPTAVQAEAAPLVRLSAALQLLHLFALVHDDVMDRSDVRRGLETVHRRAARLHGEAGARGDADRYGDAVAVLLGDLLLAEASSLAADLPAAVRGHWRRMLVELVHGQLLDVTATAASGPRDAHLSALVARLKTGRYTVRRPLELGAGLATDDPVLLAALATWGDLIGDAFGLRDDVLGVWGDPSVTGKPGLDDLLDGTATRLLAWTEEADHRPARGLLDRCAAGSLDRAGAADLARAMDTAGVRRRAEHEVDRLLREADAVVRQVVDPTAAADLAHLADGLARRDR